MPLVDLDLYIYDTECHQVSVLALLSRQKHPGQHNPLETKGMCNHYLHHHILSRNRGFEHVICYVSFMGQDVFEVYLNIFHGWQKFLPALLEGHLYVFWDEFKNRK